MSVTKKDRRDFIDILLGGSIILLIPVKINNYCNVTNRIIQWFQFIFSKNIF